MFGFNRSGKKLKFDKKILRKNDISLLTLDERWNSLFANTEKDSEILRCETRIKELLKRQAKILGESRDLGVLKKKKMDRILSLTTEAYDKANEKALRDMQNCEKEIKSINERLKEVEKELEELPELLREANLELLEFTVNLIYFNFRKNQKRREELNKLIEETRLKLKSYIEEKELLAQDNTDIYSYFHDLLGGEELEKLDRMYFAE